MAYVALEQSATDDRARFSHLTPFTGWAGMKDSVLEAVKQESSTCVPVGRPTPRRVGCQLAAIE